MNDQEVYKRYMLFNCPDYYSSGGLFDVVASFDSLEEFEEWKVGKPRWASDTWQLFDRVEGKVVTGNV